MDADMAQGTTGGGARGYTTEEIADSFATAQQQPKWLGLVVSTTHPTRDFARQQLVTLQSAYVVAVLAIFASELTRGQLPTWLLYVWLAESFINLAARLALFARMMSLETSGAFARTRFLRLVPLINVVVVGGHWMWTAHLFIGPSLDQVTLVFTVAFTLLSVAAISISPASPIPAFLYPGFLWGSFGTAIAGTAWASPAVMVMFLLLMLATTAITYFAVAVHVRRYLVKSDEVELLLDDLRRSNSQLGESNADLEKLRQEAQMELEARSEYFSSASHDLKQRLHTLKLLSGALPTTGDGPVTAEAAESLRNTVEDLQSYLSDILEFARCEHVAQGMSIAQVDLQAVFQHLNVEFEDMASNASVDLQFRTTTLQIMSDRLMLTRILENLISNAVKYCRPGGKVLVAARALGEEVRLEVWDQGLGMPQSAQEAVFRPFYQLPYYSRRVDGIGLGLAIVERLSRALGYTIEVHSREGRGTLMRVIAPLLVERRET